MLGVLAQLAGPAAIIRPAPCRRSSPRRSASAAQPRRSLLPVRPGVGTDDAAPGAHHARAERWHWHVIGPRVGAQDRPVVALPAAHVERPHAVGAHVAEGHRRASLGSWCAHAGEDIRASSATASSGRCALRWWWRRWTLWPSIPPTQRPAARRASGAVADAEDGDF